MSTKLSLTQIARAGFSDLDAGRSHTEQLCERFGLVTDDFLALCAQAADADAALKRILQLSDRAGNEILRILTSPDAALRLIKVVGASEGLTEFLLRNPSALATFTQAHLELPDDQAFHRSLSSAVKADHGIALLPSDEGRCALRVAYRLELLNIAIFDLMADSPELVIRQVTEALSDLAGAAVEASIAVARRDLIDSQYSQDQLRALDFAVIGMGKCGARELNYVSDVDVIFVAESNNIDVLPVETAATIGTKIAQLTMRGINETAVEPGLWEVDPNLRPEGKAGALVRTLESHVAYYERWAKNWEFQALLKARPIAGSVNLGERYIAAVAPFIWSSASRVGFVDQVQRMRERVTEHIPVDDVEWQVKLGPGGLRDIEFTVQLLQLVHGQSDNTIRLRGTLESLQALSDGGYVARLDAQQFAQHYRQLRLIEHRLQLNKLARTHLMPRDEFGQRLVARSTGLAANADELLDKWNAIKLEVRQLHQKIFYRPLLAAVASLTEDDLRLSTDQAEARLAAIGFRDSRAALTHIQALTLGVSRRATIQRNLMPVILQWISAGTDPDYGLLAFRRLSESLGDSHWYLRMLRDGVAAAERLTVILTGSRYITDLLEKIPEAVAWLDDDDELVPREIDLLRQEVAAIVERHPEADVAVKSLRMLRRREVLRMSMGSVVNVGSMIRTSQGLTDLTTAILDGFLNIAMRDFTEIEFAIIGMGRFGGGELGFGSDADVMFVYRALSTDDESAAKQAAAVAALLGEYASDVRLSLELDLDLRPEGKNGPRVRTLASYAAYYARWSEIWESQALLRATPVAGNTSLLVDFFAMIDPIRYAHTVTPEDAREIRRIKARVESERLPQGTDPSRHLKLGRGSLSDVEWTVQLIQLLHGADNQNLRTTSTLAALQCAVADGLMSDSDAETLSRAWLLSSRLRSALVLWGLSNSDVLPSDFVDLNGIGRLLGYPAGSASQVEEDYLSITRKSRQVFERLFYGQAEIRRRS